MADPARGVGVPPARIILFVPCYVDQLRPQAGIAAVELLEDLGHEIEVRSEAICCGQPFANSGLADESREATAAWFAEMQGRTPVVVLSSSCTVHLRHDGALLPLGAPPPLWEFCEFLARYHPTRPGGTLEQTVCLHSSCHGLRDSAADRAARVVLETIRGLRVVQAARRDECCGFGGSFSVTFPELSVRMGSDRLREIAATEAPEVIATDLSCLIHLEGIARAERLALRFRHISEVLRDAMRPPVTEVS